MPRCNKRIILDSRTYFCQRDRHGLTQHEAIVHNAQAQLPDGTRIVVTARIHWTGA